jgi:hypothetical protein
MCQQAGSTATHFVCQTSKPSCLFPLLVCLLLVFDMQMLLDRLDKLNSKAIDMDVTLLDKKIDQMMPELGFKQADNDRLVASFSGGWQMRMCLGKLLLQVGKRGMCFEGRRGLCVCKCVNRWEGGRGILQWRLADVHMCRQAAAASALGCLGRCVCEGGGVQGGEGKMCMRVGMLLMQVLCV